MIEYNSNFKKGNGKIFKNSYFSINQNQTQILIKKKKEDLFR